MEKALLNSKSKSLDTNYQTLRFKIWWNMSIEEVLTKDDKPPAQPEQQQ